MGIQVPPDSTGKVVETNSPDGATQRQVVTVGDKTTAANVAAVLASGAVKVEPGGANTQPVTQSGTWNITNVSGTVSLPTGASTSAKQPALGTAGTASSDVITIQGIASMTAVKVDGSAVTQPVSAASLPLPSGAATSAKQPALGTAGSASSDVISIQGIASMTAVKVDGSGVTQPVSGTVTANLGTIAGVATSAKQPALGTAGTPSSDVITVQGNASGTPIPVSGTFSASFGTATSGGYTIKHVVSAANTNPTSVKGSAGQVYGWSIYNNATYPV